MKKILVLLLISFSIFQVSSDEKPYREPEEKSNNKYYKIARSLYQKPFGETLCIPFIWLGNLTDNKLDPSNKHKLTNSDQGRKINLTNWSQLSLQYLSVRH